MAASPKSACGFSPAFSPKGQPVAFRVGSEDRSIRHSRRTRLATHAAPAPLVDLLGDFLVRTRRILSLFAASLIAFAPMHAMAQDQEESVSVRERSRADYDPLGLRLGGFTLHATLDLNATNSDNIFAEETAEDEDTILTAGLRGRLSSNWSRHALAFEAGGATVIYDEFSSEDYDTSFAGVSGRLDIGSSSNVNARARIAHDVESRRDPDAPAQGAPRPEFDRTELALGAQHRFNRFRVGATVTQIEQEFDGLQSFRDFDQTGVTGRVEAELTPRLGLLAQVTADERDYDNTPLLSSEGQTYLVGATINFTDLMKGEVAVGQFERDYDDPAIGTVDGLALSGNLEWYVTRLTTLSFLASRNSETNVGAVTATPFVESRYGARVDHELLRNLILTVGAQAGSREYDDVISREDDFVYADAGMDWFVNRRLVVSGRVEHTDVSSDLTTAEFDETSVTLGISLRL
jgi:hypothetical protein